MREVANKKYVISYSFLAIDECSNGTAKYIVSQQQQFNQYNVSYMYIYGITKKIKGKPLVTRYDVVIDGVYIGAYSIYELQKELYSLNRGGAALVAIFIQHLLHANLRDVFSLVGYLAPVPIYFCIHDFATVCSNYMLTYNYERSCVQGQELYKDCQTCNCYAQQKQIIPIIRDFFEEYSERIKGIFCPSESVKRIWQMAYPQYKEKAVVVPHLIFDEKLTKRVCNIDTNIKVAYLGRKTDFKGWYQWERLVKEVGNDDSLQFYVLGTELVDEPNMIYKRVGVSNDCLNAMTKALIENEIDITILWSLCSETYSYTCMESMEAGTYIVTAESSGNIADVVREKKCGQVFKTEEQLIDFFRPENREYLKECMYRHYDSDNSCLKSVHNNDYIVKHLQLEATVNMWKRPKYRKWLHLYDKIMLGLWSLMAKFKSR